MRFHLSIWGFSFFMAFSCPPLVRTVLLAIISFMPTPGDGAVGSLDVPRVERQKLAARLGRDVAGQSFSIFLSRRCATGSFPARLPCRVASSPNWKCPVCDKHNRDQLATEVDAEVEKADQAERAEAAKLVLRGAGAPWEERMDVFPPRLVVGMKRSTLRQVTAEPLPLS